MNKWIITPWETGLLMAYFKDGAAQSLQWLPRTKGCLVGDIRIGRVETVNKQLSAAFVRISSEEIVYFPYKEKAPKPGEELVIQIVKEAYRSKLATGSAELSYTGKYLVFSPGRSELGFSKKLTNKKRKKELSELMIPYCEHGSFIVRTNAGEAGAEDICREAESLLALHRDVLSAGRHRPFPCLLYRAMPAYIAQLRDMRAGEPGEIITDDASIYEELLRYIMENEEAAGTAVRLYEDKQLSLTALYSLRSVVDRALEKRVWLKSGGYLVIEPTEALVVIDVNAGKVSGNKDFEETIFMINREAAQEIARQLRLRNLAGIIIVDFISMKDSSRLQEVVQLLRDCVADDPMRVTIVGVSPLQLLEMTRKKVLRPFYEQIAQKGCTFHP